MSQRDFYDVLGVPKSATVDEIRKAYRVLVRKLHPDVNKAPDAQKKFTEVQEAYDVLSDEQKRKLYDQFGQAGVRGGPPPSGGGARSGGRPQVDVNGLNIDDEELKEVFESIFGGGGMGGGGFGGRSPRGGRAGRAAQQTPEETVRHELLISFEAAARGTLETVRLSTPDGAGKRIEVKVPAGVEDGAQLRVRATRSTPEVMITVRIGSHPLFRRGEFVDTGKGLDLYLDMPLTIAEATLGTMVNVPTLWGVMELTVPPGTGSGRKLRLRGKGLRDDAGREGDLYVIAKVVAPQRPPSEIEASVLREISEREPSPRLGAGWPQG
ncbi:MAG: DnaJ C-terminal domain-containing protein [Phycisphaerales bacterium]|jgi:curved DNA-binding protein